MQVGIVLAGKYRLIKRLGEGAMGVVWLAKNEMTERLVAIKCPTLSDDDSGGSESQGREAKERFIREARSCGRISHRNVVEVLDVGESEDEQFMVMQLLQGQTLEAAMARLGRLAPEAAFAIARAIASGLQAAHKAKIFHRDLKPANVFLHQEDGTPWPIVKVADFGLSRVGDMAALTKTGLTMGTPAYMSPEQLRAEKELNHRADIWSLGVVLYEMLTGGACFPGKSTYAVMEAILKHPVPSVRTKVPSLSEAAAGIVDRCLIKDASKRFQECSEIITAIDAAFPALADGNNPAAMKALMVPLRAVDASPKSAAQETSPTLVGHKQSLEMSTLSLPGAAAIDSEQATGLSSAAVVSDSRPRTQARRRVARVAAVALGVFAGAVAIAGITRRDAANQAPHSAAALNAGLPSAAPVAVSTPPATVEAASEREAPDASAVSPTIAPPPAAAAPVEQSVRASTNATAIPPAAPPSIGPAMTGLPTNPYAALKPTPAADRSAAKAPPAIVTTAKPSAPPATKPQSNKKKNVDLFTY